MEYLLEIPGRLDGLNSYTAANRTNPRKGGKVKHDNENKIIWCIRQQLNGVHIEKPVLIYYHFYEKDNRRDGDNILSCATKFIQDSLTKTHPKFEYKIYSTYMGVTRWCEGKIYKFDLPSGNVNRTMTMTITFLCPTPFLKSYDNFGKNIASVEGMCGFPYLCSITDGTPKGITGGRFNFAQLIVLENDGDVETFCKAVFKASGEVVNPKLTVNGNYVRLIDTMQLGDVITIDFTKNPPTVQKNGENYIGHCDRTSAFDDMALVVGDSEISFDADTGSNLLDVSIYYNKLYGAI